MRTSLAKYSYATQKLLNARRITLSQKRTQH